MNQLVIELSSQPHKLSNESAAVEGKTLVVQKKTERALGSHRL
jgi:hypothetical protein